MCKKSRLEVNYADLGYLYCDLKPFEMKKLLIGLCMLAFAGTASAQNQPPVLEQLFTNVDPNAGILHVTYSVSDPENDLLEIQLQFSSDGGRSYSLNLPATGDLGFPVTPGNDKKVDVDINALTGLNGNYRVRLIVLDQKPFDVAALVGLVDSNRMRSDLYFIEGIRHRTGGAAHLQAVRDSIQNHFYALELHTEEQNFTFPNANGYNYIGTLPGTVHADTVVIIDAHYDTVVNSPGADDNGSGVAGVLEAARILSRFPSDKSLRFIGFDLEESGLIGSTQYVANFLPADEHAAGVLNFEMIGYFSQAPNSQTLPAGFNILFPDAYNAVAAQQFRGNFITNVGNAKSAALVDLFDQSAATYVPNLRVASLKAPGNSEVAPDLRRSDHTPFWQAGISALMITDGANFRNACYHTAKDSAEDKLTFSFMADVLRATIATAAQMAGSQHGDWATAPFNALVTTNSVPSDPCNMQVRREGNRLAIHFEHCNDEQARLELFNTQGQLLIQSTIYASADTQWISLPPLTAGTYLVHMRTRSATQTITLTY